MNTIPVIDGEKLKRARGQRTRREIVEASGGAFTEPQLHAWESGEYRPRAERVPALLRALRVNFEDITSPLRP